jgi:hypothetical protein
MSDTFEIIEFIPEDNTQLDLICAIHSDVLPDSFVVKMGDIFMKQFYYKCLSNMGSLKCFLARYNGGYVGMIVTNRKPFSLIKSAIPTFFWRICFVMFVSILKDPRRIRTILNLLIYKPDPLLKTMEDSKIAFEILTIGVLADYRKIYITEHEKISHKILKHAVNDYKKNGYKKITGQILKSNRMALGFYETFNADFVQSTTNPDGVILDLNIENVK